MVARANGSAGTPTGSVNATATFGFALMWRSLRENSTAEVMKTCRPSYNGINGYVTGRPDSETTVSSATSATSSSASTGAGRTPRDSLMVRPYLCGCA